MSRQGSSPAAGGARRARGGGNYHRTGYPPIPKNLPGTSSVPVPLPASASSTAGFGGFEPFVPVPAYGDPHEHEQDVEAEEEDDDEVDGGEYKAANDEDDEEEDAYADGDDEYGASSSRANASGKGKGKRGRATASSSAAAGVAAGAKPAKQPRKTRQPSALNAAQQAQAAGLPIPQKIATSANANGKVFQCTGYPGCAMVFSRSEHLARHIRKHTGERPFTCRCGRSFSRLDNLRQHCQTVHHDQPEQNATMLEGLAQIHSNLSYKASMTHRGAAGRTRNPPAQVAQMQQELPAMPAPAHSHAGPTASTPTLGPAGSLDAAVGGGSGGGGQPMLPQMGDFPLGPFPAMPPLSSGSNTSGDAGNLSVPANKRRKPSPLQMQAGAGGNSGASPPRSASLGRTASSNAAGATRASVSPRMATRSAATPPVSSGSTGSRTKKTYSNNPTMASGSNGLASMSGTPTTIPGMSVPNTATSAASASYYQPYQTQGVHGSYYPSAAQNYPTTTYFYPPQYQHKLLSTGGAGTGAGAAAGAGRGGSGSGGGGVATSALALSVPLNGSLSSSSSSSSSAMSPSSSASVGGGDSNSTDLSNLSQYYSQPTPLGNYQPFTASAPTGYPHQQQQQQNSAAAAAAAAAGGINYANLPVMPTSEGRHIPNLDALISVMQNEDYSAGGGGKQGQGQARQQQQQRQAMPPVMPDQQGGGQGSANAGAGHLQQQQHQYPASFPPFDFSNSTSSSATSHHSVQQQQAGGAASSTSGAQQQQESTTDPSLSLLGLPGNEQQQQQRQ